MTGVWAEKQEAIVRFRQRAGKREEKKDWRIQHMGKGHPNGYYTATKSSDSGGKWYRGKLKKSDTQKKAFKAVIDTLDPSHMPIKFTTNFTPGNKDTAA